MRTQILPVLLFFVTPIAAQNTPPALDIRHHAVVSAVSTEQLEKDITKLANFGTRHTLSDNLSDRRGIGTARDGYEDSMAVKQMAFPGNWPDISIKQTITYMPGMNPTLICRLDRFGRDGHHRPFNDEGFAGVRIKETHENYNRQHQELRTENGIDYGDVLY